MGYGINGHVGICFQQSFGTAFTSSFHYMNMLSESLVETKNPIVREHLKGRYSDSGILEGFNTIAGDIVMQAHPILIGKILKAWCGQSSSGGPSGMSYTHTFKPRDADWDEKSALPPMTIEVYRGAGSAHQYYDCVADGININIAHGAIVSVTMSVIGGKFSKVAKRTPTFQTGNEFTFDQASITLGGTATDKLTSLVISGKNNVEAKGTLNAAKTAARIRRTGFRLIEISGALLYEDDTELDKARAFTEARLFCTLLQGGSNYITFDFPSFEYTSFPVNIGGPGTVEVSFAGRANYNAGSATEATFILVNSHSIY